VKPELRTARLVLLPLCEADAAWVAALERDPDIARYVPYGRVTEEQARACIAHASLGYLAIGGRSDDRRHGWVALKPLDGEGDIEIGFRLQPSSRRQGFATEAARELLRYGFEVAKLSRVVAVTTRDNGASQRVIQALGMRLEKSVFYDGVEWLNYELRAE
jgi:ribosomal-protein-alanine N-acetyltransferase